MNGLCPKCRMPFLFHHMYLSETTVPLAALMYILACQSAWREYRRENPPGSFHGV